MHSYTAMVCQPFWVPCWKLLFINVNGYYVIKSSIEDVHTQAVVPVDGNISERHGDNAWQVALDG